MTEMHRSLAWEPEEATRAIEREDTHNKAVHAIQLVLAEDPGPWRLAQLREKAQANNPDLSELELRRATLDLLASDGLHYTSDRVGMVFAGPYS